MAVLLPIAILGKGINTGHDHRNAFTHVLIDNASVKLQLHMYNTQETDDSKTFELRGDLELAVLQAQSPYQEFGWCIAN